MKEENKNIDRFFADRLAQNQVEEEWNVPSDDIWLAAKPHFAKKDKKKRRFVFWIFVAALLTSALFIFDMKSNSTEQAIAVTTDTTKNNTTKNNSTEKTTDSSTIETETPATESITVNKNADQLIDIKEPKSNSVTESEGNIINKKIVSQSIDNVKNIASTSTINNFKTISTESTNDLRQPTISKEQAVIVKANNITPKPILTTPIAIADAALSSSAVTKIEKNRELIEIEKLSDTVAFIDTKKSKVVDFDGMMATALIPIIPVSYTPKQEIGLSHSKYLLQLFLQDDVISDEEVQIQNFSSSVRNINVSHRRWYNKNISYAYGAYLSNLKMNFDLDAVDTLDQDISSFVSDKYEIATRRNSSDIDVELLDGFELLEGDIINIKGNIGLNLLVVQLPIMVDYHIYKNRMEYLFGSGVSFDILHVTQEESDISIFKQQQLVNKPLKSARNSEFLYDYSLYANIGAKYHINKNWNIGVSAKVSVLEPIFSFAEIGIYHRWHR